MEAEGPIFVMKSPKEKEAEAIIDNDIELTGILAKQLLDVKPILSGCVGSRTVNQTEVAYHYIKNLKFFKNKSSLNSADLLELAGQFKMDECKKDKCVVVTPCGGPIKFFVILSGVVRVRRYNSAMINFESKLQEYNDLVEWKKTEFDPMCERRK